MRHELADRLKKARFPFMECCLNENGVCMNRHCNQTLNDYHFCDPTISELIKACGEDFRMLLLHTQFTKRLDKPWEAVPNKKRVPEIKGQKGSTPEEAVSYLWLALNKKKGE